MENRGWLTIKRHAFQRYLTWYFFQPLFNNVRVAEFPKSGGTWLCQMLSELFELDYPRNSNLSLNRCVQHSHYPGPTRSKTIVLIRDGRDVITSAYFHFLMVGSGKAPGVVERWQRLLPSENYDNVVGLMPEFIKVFSDNFKVGGRNITWSDHVMSYGNTEIIKYIKYEDLLKDARKELEQICSWHQFVPQRSLDDIIEKYSFKNQSQRKAGQENRQSFLRKGISEDWKNYFNKEAEEVFDFIHGDALRFHGYV